MRASMDKRLFIALGTFAVVCLLAMESEAEMMFTMEMRGYYNPYHRKWDGRCCDVGFFMCGKCDTYFKICVTQDHEPRSYSDSRCYVLRHVYGTYRNMDSFTMRYSATRYLQSRESNIYILVESWDKDLVFDDLVDEFRYKLPAIPSRNTRYMTLSGDRATLRVSFKVYCDTHYYGKKCEKYSWHPYKK